MKAKLAPLLKSLVFAKHIEKALVILLAISLAGLSVLIVVKSLAREDVTILDDRTVTKFVIPEKEEQEVASLQKFIEEWNRVPEFVAYQGLSRRDFFGEYGPAEIENSSTPAETSYLALTILYEGSIQMGDAVRAQINWQEGKRIKTYFVAVEEIVNGYKVLEIVPREKVKLQSPAGEEIILEYKKAYTLEEKTSGGV